MIEKKYIEFQLSMDYQKSTFFFYLFSFLNYHQKFIHPMTLYIKRVVQKPLEHINLRPKKFKKLNIMTIVAWDGARNTPLTESIRFGDDSN